MYSLKSIGIRPTTPREHLLAIHQVALSRLPDQRCSFFPKNLLSEKLCGEAEKLVWSTATQNEHNCFLLFFLVTLSITPRLQFLENMTIWWFRGSNQCSPDDHPRGPFMHIEFLLNARQARSLRPLLCLSWSVVK